MKLTQKIRIENFTYVNINEIGWGGVQQIQNNDEQIRPTQYMKKGTFLNGEFICFSCKASKAKFMRDIVSCHMVNYWQSFVEPPKIYTQEKLVYSTAKKKKALKQVYRDKMPAVVVCYITKNGDKNAILLNLGNKTRYPILNKQ